MRYAMLIMDTETCRALSDADREAWMSEVRAWYEKGADGRLLDGGYELVDARKARTVRASGVFDGPFMETKEILGGFSVLETDTLDEAVEIASTWPGVDRGYITIEVRSVV
jgi:hypothetical protein